MLLRFPKANIQNLRSSPPDENLSSSAAGNSKEGFIWKGLWGQDAVPCLSSAQPWCIANIAKLLAPGQSYLYPPCALAVDISFLRFPTQRTLKTFPHHQLSGHYYLISSPSFSDEPLELWGSFARSSPCSEYVASTSADRFDLDAWSHPGGKTVGCQYFPEACFQLLPNHSRCLKPWLWFLPLVLIINAYAWQLDLFQLKLHSGSCAILALTF